MGLVRSLFLAEGAFQDTSGSPLEGGETAPMTNTRCTTIQPTHQHPPRPTRTNEINFYSYIRTRIYLAFAPAFDLYLVFYMTMSPHTLSAVILSFPSCMLSYTSQPSVHFAYRFLAVVLYYSLRLTPLSLCLRHSPPRWSWRGSRQINATQPEANAVGTGCADHLDLPHRLSPAT